MSIAALNIIGLVLNLVGVIILFRYGMPFHVPTGGATYIISHQVDAGEKALERRYELFGFRSDRHHRGHRYADRWGIPRRVIIIAFLRCAASVKWYCRRKLINRGVDMKATLIFPICFLSVIAPAFAGFYSGNEVATQCQVKRQFVYGYISGAVDKATMDAPALYEFYVETMGTTGAKQSETETNKINEALGDASVAIEGYCIPKGATVGQTGDVFCKYLQENPAQRQKSAAELLNVALKSAWPCKQK
jgi:Rap1a immunity proteins